MSVAISGQKWVASRKPKHASSYQNMRSYFHLCTHQATPTLLLAASIALLLGTNGPFAVQGTSGMHCRARWGLANFGPLKGSAQHLFAD